MIDPNALEVALQAIFGAPADDIHVSHLDHLACTLTARHVVLLLHAGGPAWERVLKRIFDKREQLLAAKDPGEDVRHREEAKR